MIPPLSQRQAREEDIPLHEVFCLAKTMNKYININQIKSYKGYNRVIEKKINLSPSFSLTGKMTDIR